MRPSSSGNGAIALARQARQLSEYPVGDLACFNVDFSREFRYCLETGVDPTPASELSTLRLSVPVTETSNDIYGKLSVAGDTVTGSPTDILTAVYGALDAHNPDVLVCSTSEIVSTLYVMIDEFQDTSEIQFKLSLLLAGSDNICVVGDWKQSIYSFQYADVENIRNFESRLADFTNELNRDHERVDLPTESVEHLELTTNYRSTQSVLDFSEHALQVPATGGDSVDTDTIEDSITSLGAEANVDNSVIEAIRSDEEHEAILEKIDQIVGNPDYQVEADDDGLRPPRYEDIAVLTRTRDFGRELLDTAAEYEFPLAYEGGIEVFRTDAAKLLLAWLRILEFDADRGWALVLEEAGYTIDEVDHILEREAFPTAMTAFRADLDEMETVGGVARRVFDRYGCAGPTADVVLHTIQSVFESSTMTRGDLISFVEDAIEAGSTHEVDGGAGTNTVTVQTIHATKGLEYPIVILANMNRSKFPSTGGGGGDIWYEDPVGIRQRSVFSREAHGIPYVYDNWHADVLRWSLPREYDEERRLLYVAITRAENHVVFTAGENPNTFLEALPVDVTPVEPDLSGVTPEADPDPPFEVEITASTGPSRFSPHTFIDEAVFEEGRDGRGMEFGTDVHEFAEAYILGEDVTAGNDDQQHVKGFLEPLAGELRAEEEAFLPLTVDGERVTISGVIDLLHVTEDTIDIVDYKTDFDRHAESEYRKQLSVYYHVVDGLFPAREVTTSIYYTADDERTQLSPLSKPELRDLVRELSEG